MDRHTSSFLDASTAVKSLRWVSSGGTDLRAAGKTAGRGKWEARFARGIWVGKSEIDDMHLVMDLERGIQKVRTVRRMPLEFRWNAVMLQDIRFTPWKPTPGKSAQVVGQNMYMDRRTAAESALPGKEIIRNADRGLRRFSMICCRRNSDRHQSFQRRVENKPS